MAKLKGALCIARRKSELPTDVAMPGKKGTDKRSNFQDIEAKRRESKKSVSIFAQELSRFK